jgi:hypothetical protein
MKILVSAILIVMLAGCAVKVPSILPENAGKGVKVTVPQLKIEAATLKARIGTRIAAFDGLKATEAAAIETEIALVNEKIAVANADAVEQQERNNYVFTTVYNVAEAASAALPVPYGPLALLGLGIAGSIFGVVRQLQKSKADANAATAVGAVDVMAQAIKTAGSTATATVVQANLSNLDAAKLIADRVKATGSDIL